MKEFTNHTAGPRGFNIKDEGTRWIEPGETVSIDPKTIVGEYPDLGKPPVSDDKTDDLIASVQKENADLKKQVGELTAKLEAAVKK